MCRKWMALTVLPCAVICTVLFDEAQTQLARLPAVPFAIVNCHPGDHWRSSLSHGGLLRCLISNPPPASTCPAGSTQASAPMWNGGAWSQPVCAIIPPPTPPPSSPGHAVVATATTNSRGTLGVFNTYVDGTYSASNPDWSQFFSGTRGQMFSNGAVYMNQNYAHYYQPMHILQPSDPNTATQYLSRVFFVNNPRVCGDGVD